MDGQDNRGFTSTDVADDDGNSPEKVAEDTGTEESDDKPGKSTPFCQFKSVLTFTIFCGLSHFFYGMARSILNAQIISFERQFGLSSSLSGLMNTANSVGMASTSLISAHFARTANIPKLTGIAGIITGLALTTPGILYFIHPYHMDDQSFITHSNLTNGSHLVDKYMCTEQSAEGKNSGYSDTEHENKMAFYVIIFVMVIKGMTVPLRFGPVPTIFIDNNITDKTKVGIYMGIMTVSGELVGPLGELFNGFISDVPVDLSESDISPTDPRFVSAWWLGFLVFGSCTLLVSLPLLLLPRHIIPVAEQKAALKKAMVTFAGGQKDAQKSRNKGLTGTSGRKSQDERKHSYLQAHLKQRRDSVDIYVDPTQADPGMTEERRFSSAPQVIEVPITEGEEKKSVWQNIKDTLIEAPKGIRRIFTNPLWVLLFVEISILVIPWIGLGTFGIKYVIFEYHVTASYANFARGFSTAITNILGTVLSSLICIRIKTRRGYLYLIVVCIFLSTCIVPLYWFFACDNNTIYGLKGHLGAEVKNQTKDCQCNDHQALLSCGEDGNSYLSPCTAGCMVKNGTGHYSTCLNLEHGDNLDTDMCDPGCFNNFIIYNVAKAMSVFFYQLSYMPRHLLSLRITQPEDRAIAHAFIFFGAIVVSIPAPVLFGRFLDTGCMLWTGQCAYYDRDLIRDIVVGGDFFTHAFALLIYIMMVFVCLRQDSNLKKGQAELPESNRPRDATSTTRKTDGIAPTEGKLSPESGNQQISRL